MNKSNCDNHHERTMALIARAQQGDRQAEGMLIEENMALVHSVAKRFRDRGVEYEDIFQMGCVGFLKAVKRFDASYNVCFSTYAVPMIMGEIRRTLRDDGMVKVSRSIRETAKTIMHTQETLQCMLGRSPTLQEVADHCGLKPEEISFYLESLVQPLSIDEPLPGDGGAALRQGDHMPGLENQEETTLNHILIRQAMGQLPPREKRIIYLRYFKDQTQNEIASTLGVSQVQISRLEKKILKKMRYSMM
ncbi:MAG: SigB/SigF/SigG family RNA polymerase sigma factor [Christensenellales bacterium]|jgi:RNA polymerase sporulation-specific sigma factor